MVDSVPIPTAASSGDPFTLDEAIVAGGGNTASLDAIPVLMDQTVMPGMRSLVSDGTWHGVNLTVTEVVPSQIQERRRSGNHGNPGG